MEKLKLAWEMNVTLQTFEEQIEPLLNQLVDVIDEKEMVQLVKDYPGVVKHLSKMVTETYAALQKKDEAIEFYENMALGD